MLKLVLFPVILSLAVAPALRAQVNGNGEGDDSETRMIREAGDVVQFAIPLTALASTFIEKDKDGTLQLLKSFGFGLVSVWSLKEISGKLRPDASNPKSFPSGHTFAAFSGASFLNRRYGPKIGVPAYVAAGFVGYTRVHGQKHYLDDVIAGASIALFWNWRFTQPFHENVNVEPMLVPGGYGLAVNASW